MASLNTNQCLQEIIKSARIDKKTAHITFFDLEDAFGSVQHNSISHCLKRFQFPDSTVARLFNLKGGEAALLNQNLSHNILSVIILFIGFWTCGLKILLIGL